MSARTLIAVSAALLLAACAPAHNPVEGSLKDAPPDHSRPPRAFTAAPDARWAPVRPSSTAPLRASYAPTPDADRDTPAAPDRPTATQSIPGAAATGLPQPGSITCPADAVACQQRLAILLDSSDHAWVETQPDAADHLTGARLFAFEAIRAEATCAELAIARAEADKSIHRFAAALALVNARDPGLQQLHDAAVAIERNLGIEQATRC